MENHDITNSDFVTISQKALVFTHDGKVLLLKRSNTAPLRANGWDLCGGGLGFGEDPITGITREIKEETGLEVINVKPIDIVSFLENNQYTVMVGYQALAKTSEVKLSFEHDNFQWVTKDKFQKLELPETFKRFLSKANL